MKGLLVGNKLKLNKKGNLFKLKILLKVKEDKIGKD